MVLKLPRDLLDYVMAQTNGRAMQTVIIEILRQHKSCTQNRGINNDNTEKRIQQET
jgi:hypothetical protein